MNGFFVSFEGIDGCGKSTQIEKLLDRMAGTFQIADEYPKQTGFCLIQSSPILQPL